MPRQLLISIPGVPLAKKRHRTVALLQCTGCQRKLQGQYKECPHCSGALRFLTNLSYSDSESVKYENLVSYCGQQAMTAAGITMFSGAIRVSCTFIFPIPSSRVCKKVHDDLRPKKDCKKLHVNDWHTQRPDRDNLDKSTNDGLNGIAFADDCIIADGSIRKLWGEIGKAEILVEEL